MLENNSALYAAFIAKDTRFDGRFFAAISSTGIYCRPVCRAKQPKIENCTFYSTAAEAEQAGYRPCLLCRPECAPGKSITDATANLAYRTARMLEENCSAGQSLDEIATQLGYTDRHLRRAFSAEYHVSPIQYLQTCRLLLAKSLLTDTSLSVLDIAMAAGFGSLRRFNDLFKTHYHLSPTALRKSIVKNNASSGNITLALSYRPPYPWQDMLNFLAGRAIKGIEQVSDDKYWRTVHLVDAQKNSRYGWIEVSHVPKNNVLSVKISETLLPVIPQVLARVKHLFDLYCDPDIIYDRLKSMNTIRPNLAKLGTRVPGCFDAFEMSVRAVLGQQITVKAASTLASRVVTTYGIPVKTDIEGLTHVFPTAADILAMGDNITDNLGVLGVIATRSHTIYELAGALVQRDIDFTILADPEAEIKKLMAIRGIGSWTAQYIAMRAMQWPDAFLETDAGVKKALQPYSPKQLLNMAEDWRPWRSYATVNLWHSL